jgi:hypothetical protein
MIKGRRMKMVRHVRRMGTKEMHAQYQSENWRVRDDLVYVGNTKMDLKGTGFEDVD